MTVYEQIQRTLDLVEKSLSAPVPQARAAREAAMSVRSFQDWFWMLTGHTYKEYLLGRRLAASLSALEAGEQSIVNIALDCGYRSHEAYTRAFRKEFGIAPRDYRLRRPALETLGPLRLYKEMYMGVIVKELSDLSCVSFMALGHEPENKAKALLNEWRGRLEKGEQARRIFGHNVDASGCLTCGPSYAGYKFYAVVNSIDELGQAPMEIIKAGRFVVTGIEGSFANDPAGSWISKGWARLNSMIAAKGYRVKQAGRWFEEELEPASPDQLRLDLYLEIE